MPKTTNYRRFWSGSCPTEFTSTRYADAAQLAVLNKNVGLPARGSVNRNGTAAPTVPPVAQYAGPGVNTFA